jgi:chromosome segregation ATPase
MNDATEFESSLAGTIDFFQNLRRKLGVLEAEAGAQHELLRTVAASVASFQHDRQADRQTLAALAGNFETQTAQLVKLQTDIRLLGEELAQVETLAGGLRQDQEQARQTLATLVEDMRTQGTTLRQELESDLKQRIVPIARVAALEEQLTARAGEMDGLLAAFQTSNQEARTVQSRMTALESRFEQIDRNARSITGTLTDLSAAIERHERTRDVLDRLVEASEAIEPQLQMQRTRLDELAESSTEVRQDLQEVRRDFSRLTGELESQRQTLAETGQTRQDLQKQQDRLKYLETLVTKVSADTSSTRQILNVLQSDLAVQSDTLRELDQTWREGLTAYQDRLTLLESTVAESALHARSPSQEPSPAASAQESPFLDAAEESPFLDTAEESPFLDTAEESPFLEPQQESPFLEPQQESPFLVAVTDQADETPPTMPAIERERFDELAASLASAREEQQELRGELAASLASAREEQQELRLELTTVQNTLATQYDYLTNLRDILADQLTSQQQRLGELEAGLATLRQTPSGAADSDLQPLKEALATQQGTLEQLRHAVEHQLHDQRQRLEEIDAALGNLSQAPAPAPEADLQPLHDAFAEHAGTMNHLRENTQQQFGALTATLDKQQLELQEVVERIDLIQRDIERIQRQPTAPEPLAERRHGLDADDAYAQELRQHLETLQDSVTLLETRLTGQAQAFSSNFEQFQGLNTDIQDLQQQVANLESSPRLDTIEQGLAGQERDIAQLADSLQQIKLDSQQIGEAIRQDGRDSAIAELEEKLNAQQEQLSGMSATVDAMRADAKATQEKVLTMAANVAQRIHEFQNQLMAAKTAQGEQLQEVEQKLIMLQAAVETMETHRKPRRWFSMPATFTTIAFTVGAAFLAVLAQVLWTTGTG